MIPWPDALRNWGTTPAERRSHFGCEELVAEPDDVLFRGVDVAAPPPIAYRWICQMRIAPYSYDLLDNRGRQSPQRLISGLDDLEPGQRIASIFRVVSFEPGRRVTMLSKGKVFGADELHLQGRSGAGPAGALADRRPARDPLPT